MKKLMTDLFWENSHFPSSKYTGVKSTIQIIVTIVDFGQANTTYPAGN